MGLEKDKGYAWVVVAASSFLMFIGPSVYNSYGLLFMGVDLRTYHAWIINSMCSLWFFTGMLAGPMAAVSTHRKIALIGCFMATCGFLMSSATLDKPVWLFLTFSILVGVGLGLAINVTFLVVAAHFEKYRGLANGIGQISVSIGYMITPFLYSIIDGPKDKLHIRALLTAVAFLSATFYLSPAPKSRSLSPNLTNGSRNSQPSENNEPLSRCDSLEDIPLVELKEENANIENHISHEKPRRRSQYLLAISASLLPKIPEESENNSLSEISATIESSPPTPHKHKNNPENHTDSSPPNRNGQEPLSEGAALNGANVPISANPSTKYESNRRSKNCANPAKNGRRNNNNSSLVKRAYKIRTARVVRHCRHDTAIELANDNEHSSRLLDRISKIKILVYLHAVVSQIEFKLFTNLQFLNMAVGSALTLITIPNFPIILCSYISLVSIEEDKEEGKEMALLIIFSLDMIARLVFSYISDFSFFSRRIGFFCGTLCATVAILCIGFVTDIYIIYCMCAIYGICMGILIATESLMFVDIFGIEKLPSTYGIVNLFKCIGFLAITFIINSPAATFMYTAHPFSYMLNNNSTTCPNCDPLGLLHYEDNQAEIYRRQNMLCIVAIPGILCSILWTIEAMWIRATKKSPRLQRSAFSENSENLRAQI